MSRERVRELMMFFARTYLPLHSLLVTNLDLDSVFLQGLALKIFSQPMFLVGSISGGAPPPRMPLGVGCAAVIQ
jgi:hypothetical protein